MGNPRLPKSGKNPPVSFQVRLPDDLYQRLEDQMFEQDKSKREIIEEAVREYLERLDS